MLRAIINLMSKKVVIDTFDSFLSSLLYPIIIVENLNTSISLSAIQLKTALKSYTDGLVENLNTSISLSIIELRTIVLSYVILPIEENLNISITITGINLE